MKNRNKPHKSNKANRRHSASVNGAKGAAEPVPTEPPPAEAATVAWLLCLLATMIGLAVIAGCRLALHRDPSPSLIAVTEAVRFATLVTGALTIMLTIAVTKVRTVPPPIGLVRFAFVCGAVPLLLIAADWFR